jgi:hypothetical protein
MPDHNCSKCNRTFKQKSHLTDHQSKKFDCTLFQKNNEVPIQNRVIRLDEPINSELYYKQISARKDKVLASYNSAVADNKSRFFDGDEKATEEYIFDNQKEDAFKIVEMFQKGANVVGIFKKTKVGMDGLMIEIAKLMTTHCDDSFVVNPANVRIITGMSNAGWEKDMKEKAPGCFKDNIFHHGQLKKADLKNMKDALIIIDEIDTGDKEYQVLHNTLTESGILNVDKMKENNIRFVFASATMIKELYDLYRWGDLHAWFKMTIPRDYIGHIEFLERGIIDEFYPLTNNENAEKWITEDIINNYGSDFRVHIVRVTNKTVNILQNACIRNNILFVNHTSSDRLSDEEQKELFEEPLSKHIVLGVKGFFRRANLIPNKWKLRIGTTHELYTTLVDNNVQIQGLPGRMTGYWRNVIEGGHKTGPHRTSKKAVLEYEKTFNDPFGNTSYKSAGFRKTKNGKIQISEPTMLSAKNIIGLVPIDLPEVPTIRDFGITDIFDDEASLRVELRKIIQIGKITKYSLHDNTIQYRGITTEIYIYVSEDEFLKLDINAGINKTPSDKGISCRIMPVLFNGIVKYIGIYSKAAARL